MFKLHAVYATSFAKISLLSSEDEISGKIVEFSSPNEDGDITNYSESGDIINTECYYPDEESVNPDYWFAGVGRTEAEALNILNVRLDRLKLRFAESHTE